MKKTVREYQRRYWCGRWPLITFLLGPIPLLLLAVAGDRRWLSFCDCWPLEQAGLGRTERSGRHDISLANCWSIDALCACDSARLRRRWSCRRWPGLAKRAALSWRGSCVSRACWRYSSAWCTSDFRLRRSHSMMRQPCRLITLADDCLVPPDVVLRSVELVRARSCASVLRLCCRWSLPACCCVLPAAARGDAERLLARATASTRLALWLRGVFR